MPEPNDYVGGTYNDVLAAQMAQNAWANKLAEQTAQLNRDRFNQIELPTYQNITLPGFQWGRTAQGIDLTGYYRPNAGASGGMDWASYGDNGALPTWAVQQYYTDLLSRNTGPKNWWNYQAMMAGRPGQSLGAMSDIFRTQPAWGAVQAQPSWNQDAARYYQTGQLSSPANGAAGGTNGAAGGRTEIGTGTTGGGNWGIPTQITQPHQISAQQLGRMTPTQREMQSGLWEAQGLNSDDMWQRTARALPQGSAARGTTYRSAWT